MDIKPYFKTELGELFLGDCLEILPKQTAWADLIVTDPPYDISFEGAGSCGKKYQYRKDEINAINKFNPLPFLEIALTATRPRPLNFYAFCSRKQVRHYLNFAEDKKLNYDILALIKSNPIPAYNNSYMADMEFIAFLREPGAFFNSKLGYDYYRKAYMGGVANNNYGHPTQKEEAQVGRYILVSSREGDTVLDPFSGSGTTAVVCEKLKRRWVGIEVNEKYAEIAAKRVRAEVDQVKMF